MIRAEFFRALFVCLFLLPAAACVSSGQPSGYGREVVDLSSPVPENAATGTALKTDGVPDPVRVAILAPQTGPSAALGEALIQAAQLAVFDVNEPQFQLIPEDTKGTPEGARKAVADAARDGARLIIGPLFSQEVEAAKEAARPYGLTVIGFSTDWRVAGDNVFTMGVLPFGQVERIADYAARQGLKRIGIIAGTDMYGDAVLSLFKRSAARYGLSVVKVARVAPDGRDATTAVRSLAQTPAAYDALFMPIGGQAAHIVASSLKIYDLGQERVRLLGTGLWDDPAILRDANLTGAVYAAPASAARTAFESSYKRVYGTAPPRLASIGYDSAALAIVLAHNATVQGRRVSYDRNTLLDPNGFSGVDGIFRFHPNGLVERGSALLRIESGESRVIEDAPDSFVDSVSVDVP